MTEQALAPIDKFKNLMSQKAGEFSPVLPSHITPEQFQRVAVTAVNNNMDLLQADPVSLMNSLMKAAQDGLLPDDREGALVIYKTKVKQGNQEKWIKKAQWMPMIGGVLAKIRRSGELASITAQVVRQGDQFDYWIDDDGEHVLHRPAFGAERGDNRLVYALAKTKDGSLYVEVLDMLEIEKIRSASKSPTKGPWADWWEQMAKKSAMHRLSKRLPISSEILDVIHRDDEFYDFKQVKDVTPQKKTMKSLEQTVAPGPVADELEPYPDQEEQPSAVGMFGSDQ